MLAFYQFLVCSYLDREKVLISLQVLQLIFDSFFFAYAKSRFLMTKLKWAASLEN